MSAAWSKPSQTTAGPSAAVTPPVPSPIRFALKGLVTRPREHDDVPNLIIPAPSPKGLAVSVSLHTALLVVMGLWYFSTPVHRSVEFDGRLAGSPDGVPEGFTLAGGLDTPLAMPEAPIEVGDPIPETLQMPELQPLEVHSSLEGARKPSASGGFVNDNPGAGAGDGFGLARFGDGGEVIRGVKVKVGDPQFTLLWNNDADLDLHVIEPGGKEIYWEYPKGNQGGELDVDNTKGYGPENIYWLVDSEGPGSEPVKGPGPPGVYKWFVVYWGGFGGIPKPTHWKVRIKHNGAVTVFEGKFRALNERSKIRTLKVDPGETKPLLPTNAPVRP
jgi:hypothetical protein